MKRVFYILLLMQLTLATFGQKRQIQIARDQLKQGKELVKVEKSMEQLLEDSSKRTNPKIWLILCEALVKQYEQGNEKLYLNQKYDTTAFFTITRKLYHTMYSFDSIDVKLSAMGKPKYRVKHSELLNSIRPNLFNGGVFFIHARNFKLAYSFFDDFISLEDQPLFNGYHYRKDDPLIPHAAYWAMYCGYKLYDASLILRHQKLAERDSSMLNFVKQYEAEAYILQKDTQRYVQTLKEGFSQYPKFAYFFPRLVDYYDKIGANDSVLIVANRALQVDSTNILFRFTKSTALLNIGRYDQSIAICKQLIEERPNFADAYYNIGMAYFNQAIELDKNWQRSKAKRNSIVTYYEKALPYIEKYKELMPESKEKWLSPLYTIYLNLNMGKEFDEIDKIKNGK